MSAWTFLAAVAWLTAAIVVTVALAAAPRIDDNLTDLGDYAEHCADECRFCALADEPIAYTPLYDQELDGDDWRAWEREVTT